MKVYVVTAGEKYEGGSTVSIHKSYDSAVKAALGQETLFDGGWVKSGTDIWVNGCDFVQVEEFEVLE